VLDSNKRGMCRYKWLRNQNIMIKNKLKKEKKKEERSIGNCWNFKALKKAAVVHHCFTSNPPSRNQRVSRPINVVDFRKGQWLSDNHQQHSCICQQFKPYIVFPYWRGFMFVLTSVRHGLLSHCFLFVLIRKDKYIIVALQLK
jgi:hypothetical protein